MRIALSCSVLATTMLLSCEGNGPQMAPTVFEESHVEGTVEKAVAEMMVQGMMCEIGCVSKVRKELLEVPGVASASIEFEKDRAVNVAKVEYDAEVVDAKDLVAKVTAIGDGMYPVEKVAVTHYGAAKFMP